MEEEENFFFKPNASVTVVAEFDLIRYTLLTSAESGVTLSEHEKRYYEGEEITLTATVEDGYVFDGWFVDGELVSFERTYTFIMPAYTYRVTAMTTPIDYNLSVVENLPNGGSLNLTEQVYHVRDEISLLFHIRIKKFLDFFNQMW